MAKAAEMGLPDSAPADLARSSDPLDVLTRIAAMILDAPLVSLAVGAGTAAPVRTWAGDPGLAGALERAEPSLGRQVTEAGQAVIVGDAIQEPHGPSAHPMDGAKRITWAGLPVRSANGRIIGVLSVADHSPRDWTTRDLAILEILARVASDQPMRGGSADAATGDPRGLGGAGGSGSQAWSSGPQMSRLQIASRFASPRSRAEPMGDFSDVFPLADGQLGLAVGNVRHAKSAAAWAVAHARFALSAAARAQSRPGMVLSGLNEALRAAQPAEPQLLTAIVATVRPVFAGVLLRMSSAGHALALLRRPDGSVQPLGRPAALLGQGPAPQLREHRALLRAGQSVILVTDSVIDARGMTDGELFGRDRLCDVVSAQGNASAGRIAAAVLDAVRDHTGGEVSCTTGTLILKVAGGKRQPGTHSAGWPGSRIYVTVDRQVPDR
jgi:phosphoserine phosphatase RsbU/P